MRAKRFVSMTNCKRVYTESHMLASTYDCRAWGFLGEKHGEAAGWGSQTGSKQCVLTYKYKSSFLLASSTTYHALSHNLSSSSVLLIRAFCQLACIQNVMLEAAALLTSSSSSLLEVCVRSLLLWCATVQLLWGSMALCGKEIGKKVTEEVETESRSRGRKASLVACSQHISLSLSIRYYRFMQVFLFPPFFVDLGDTEFIWHDWLYRKAAVPAPALQPMLDSARQAKTVSSGFRQSLEDLMQTALPLTPDDTWYATCGPVGWGPLLSNDILRSILLSRTLSGAWSQMQPRCSNSFCWPRDRLWLVLELWKTCSLQKCKGKSKWQIYILRVSYSYKLLTTIIYIHTCKYRFDT